METGHNTPKPQAKKPVRAKKQPTAKKPHPEGASENKNAAPKNGDKHKPKPSRSRRGGSGHRKSGTSQSGTSQSNTDKSNAGGTKTQKSSSNQSRPNKSRPNKSRSNKQKSHGSGQQKTAYDRSKPKWAKHGQQNKSKNSAQRPQPSPAETKLVLFNKPFQVLCQFSPEGDKETLADYMHIPEVYPAGRLDYDSEGLILLTNNGKLQHKIAHPSAKTTKAYAVQVEGTPSEEQLTQLREGVSLNDGKTRPATVQIMENQTPFPDRDPPIRERKNLADTWIELVISEGRNRQVRRMTAAVGLPTLRLVRTRIGEYELGDLETGEWHIRKNIKL